MNPTQIYCNAPVNYMGGLETIPVEVDIHNGRLAEPLDWQHNGFELLEHTSAVTDWQNDHQVAAHYYSEMATLAKSLSGCDHALVSSHISRSPRTAAEHEDYAPIQFVHSDFTENYGRRVTERYLSGDPDSVSALQAAGLTAEQVATADRMLILQFWRNTGPAAMDMPIAFCDAQTVPQADMHSIHVPSYAGGDFAFDTYAVTPAPSGAQHDWYVFPEMKADEVVAFRTFDSAMVAQGAAFWTPHSAFEDPLVGMDAPSRCSIEVRATCLFYNK